MVSQIYGFAAIEEAKRLYDALLKADPSLYVVELIQRRHAVLPNRYLVVSRDVYTHPSQLSTRLWKVWGRSNLRGEAKDEQLTRWRHGHGLQSLECVSVVRVNPPLVPGPTHDAKVTVNDERIAWCDAEDGRVAQIGEIVTCRTCLERHSYATSA